MTTDTSDVPESQSDDKPKLSLDVQVEKPSTCQRHITVTIPRADIERYFKDAFDDLRPKAEVPGFRIGRAPRKLVESRFREQIEEQVKGSLLMDSMTQVSDDSEFSAISEPDFDFNAVELPEEGSMTFEFNIEVRPEFDMPEWKGLDVEKPAHEYTDEEVAEHTKSLLGRYSKLVDHDGPAEGDDRLKIKVTFTHDGETVSTITDQVVGLKKTLSFSDTQVEDFDKLMTGCKAGDKKSVTLTISDSAPNEDLQGKEVVAEFEVEGVQRQELPEMTEAFLERIGGFSDEADLHSAVRGELSRQFDYHQQQRLREQITGLLTKGADWDLPPEMLKRQSQRELERVVMELQSSGFDDAAIRAHANRLRQNSQESTARALKEHFILERIAEEHDIEAEPEDYDREIMMIALQKGESPRRVRARLEKRGQMDTLRNQIVEKRVIDLITEHAKITEKPFERPEDDTEALDHAAGGERTEAEIPVAMHGGDAESLRQPEDRV